jgi:hypothetical protein
MAASVAFCSKKYRATLTFEEEAHHFERQNIAVPEHNLSVELIVLRKRRLGGIALLGLRAVRQREAPGVAGGRVVPVVVVGVTCGREGVNGASRAYESSPPSVCIHYVQTDAPSLQESRIHHLHLARRGVMLC